MILIINSYIDDECLCVISTVIILCSSCLITKMK